MFTLLLDWNFSGALEQPWLNCILRVFTGIFGEKRKMIGSKRADYEVDGAKCRDKLEMTEI